MTRITRLRRLRMLLAVRIVLQAIRVLDERDQDNLTMALKTWLELERADAANRAVLRARGETQP